MLWRTKDTQENRVGDRLVDRLVRPTRRRWHLARNYAVPLLAATAATLALTVPAGPSAAAKTQAVKGTPYLLVYTEVGLSNAYQYFPAIAAAINARGGIHGRPVKITDCQDQDNVNKATQCFESATSNPNVLAIIGNSSTCGSQMLQILTKAHMASVGSQLFCPEEFSSPVVFPFDAGAFVSAAGAALALNVLHQKDIVATTIDVPSGRGFPKLVQAVIAPYGGKVTASVYIPFTAADMSPYAASIANSKGILLEGNTTAIGIRLGKALQAQGYSEPILYNASEWDAATIKANFGNPTNRYLIAPYNLTSPGYLQFKTDMNKYAKGVTYRAADLSTAWLAANVIAKLANNIANPSSKAILNVLSKDKSLSTFGMTEPLNFTKPATFLGGEAKRAVNPYVGLYKYKNGTWILQGKFQDVLK